MLIGIVALIFLGPRKLPEIARKIGKMMNEFRSTTNEFKSTWEREVNFEDETQALRTGELPAAHNSILDSSAAAAAPSIKSIDREAFDALAPNATEHSREIENTGDIDNGRDGSEDLKHDELSDKRSWL